MKHILVAGPSDDPFRIPQITRAAVENSGGQAFFSMDPSDIAATSTMAGQDVAELEIHCYDQNNLL